MDRGDWQATSIGSQRVTYDWVTEHSCSFDLQRPWIEVYEKYNALYSLKLIQLLFWILILSDHSFQENTALSGLNLFNSRYILQAFLWRITWALEEVLTWLFSTKWRSWSLVSSCPLWPPLKWTALSVSLQIPLSTISKAFLSPVVPGCVIYANFHFWCGSSLWQGNTFLVLLVFDFSLNSASSSRAQRLPAAFPWDCGKLLSFCGLLIIKVSEKSTGYISLLL